MGIPKFFRWLSERYPLVNQQLEDSPSPAFDNLYLDMNGIIHRCSHPDENSLKNTISEQQIFINIFNYVDRLFHVVAPRKVFFMAVDGVAPRAKMNQQRARRFRAALDAKTARDEAVKNNEEMPDLTTVFDSNCITPGTDFMHRLSDALQFFVHKKISEDRAWRQCKIVLSGHEVPGEGEHKIQEFIRHSKAQSSWEPNQSHVVHGLDADLIMLGLATHEPNFCLLREEVLTEKARRGIPLGKETFWVLHLAVFREYLAIEFDSPKLPFQFDLERVVDDFIVMCYFVGNDFLPNLPCLDIANGSLDKIFEAYKHLLPKLGGYLSDGPTLHTERLEKFIAHLAHIERAELGDEAFVGFAGFEDDGDENDENDENGDGDGEVAEEKYLTLDRDFAKMMDGLQDADIANLVNAVEFTPVKSKSQKKREKALEASIESVNEFTEERLERARRVPRPRDLKRDEVWRHEYYSTKFFFSVRDARPVAQKYFEGLHWVLQYYHRGVASWSWFYPYHYCPLSSDMVNLRDLMPSTSATKDGFQMYPFELGKPFLPYQQLLGVLPPASSKFMPSAYAQLMLDPISPIHDFYPEKFLIDMDGKTNSWEGVVLLDFVDEKRLTAAHDSIDAARLCTRAEQDRNKLGVSHLYAYDAAALGTLESAFPQYFGPLSPVLSVRTPLVLPPLPDSFRFAITAGTGLGVLAPPGFPSLQWRVFETALERVPVNVFGGDSRQNSQVLRVLASEIAFSDARALVGNRVWMNWPNMIEGSVVAVVDSKHRYTVTGSEPVEQRVLDNVVRDESARWATKKAVRLPNNEPAAAVFVRPFIGMSSHASGARTKVFGEHEVPMLLTSLLPFELFVDSRFVERAAPALSVYFAPGTPVICVNASHYGGVGTIVECNVKQGSVKVSLTPAPKGNKLLASVVANTRPRLYPLYDAARRIGISVGVLARITSDVFVDGMRNFKGRGATRGGGVNLGLELKSNKNQELVIRYCEQDDQGRWLLTDKAITLVADYRKQFPMVFTALEKFQDVKGLPQSALLTDEQRRSLPPAVLELQKRRAAAASTTVSVPEFSNLMQRAELAAPQVSMDTKRSLHAQLAKFASSSAGTPPLEFAPMNAKDGEWLCAVITLSGLVHQLVGAGAHQHIVCSRLEQLDDDDKYVVPPLNTVLWEDHPDFSHVSASRKRELHDLISKFANGDATEYAFSPALSSHERKWLHAVLELVGVTHDSEGEGQARRIVARKLSAAGAATGALPMELREWEKPLVHQLLFDIGKYLKTVPSHSMPRVPCGTKEVPPEGVVQLEHELDRMAAHVVPPVVVTIRSPFTDLRRSIDDVDAEVDSKEASNFYTIGERVLVVAGTAAVPFGARGIVIGTEKRAVDVLFDRRYMGGTSLIGRCSNLRGLRMPSKALIHAQPVIATLAIGQHDVRQPVQRTQSERPSNSNNHNNNNNGPRGAGNNHPNSASPNSQNRRSTARTPDGRGGGQKAAASATHAATTSAPAPPMPTMLLQRGGAPPIQIRVPPGTSMPTLPVAATPAPAPAPAAPAAEPVGVLSAQQLQVLQGSSGASTTPKKSKKSKPAAVGQDIGDDDMLDMSAFANESTVSRPNNPKAAAVLATPLPFTGASTTSTAPATAPSALLQLFAQHQQQPQSQPQQPQQAPQASEAEQRAFLANFVRGPQQQQ